MEHVSLDEIKKKIQNFDVKKACQDTDISTKIIRENCDIFADFIFQIFNNGIASSVFSARVKNANITSFHKKDSKTSNLITDL